MGGGRGQRLWPREGGSICGVVGKAHPLPEEGRRVRRWRSGGAAVWGGSGRRRRDWEGWRQRPQPVGGVKGERGGVVGGYGGQGRGGSHGRPPPLYYRTPTPLPGPLPLRCGRGGASTAGGREERSRTEKGGRLLSREGVVVGGEIGRGGSHGRSQMAGSKGSGEGWWGAFMVGEGGGDRVEVGVTGSHHPSAVAPQPLSLHPTPPPPHHPRTPTPSPPTPPTPPPPLPIPPPTTGERGGGGCFSFFHRS